MNPLPGFRDFYPEALAVRRYIFDKWRDVARRYGFREFDGPPLEPLELYTQKSGEEIVGQLFNFVDKGDRAVALRPEMTPTLARMVGAHHRDYEEPIKWFAIPQLFRYEKQQRGRLREHFQFNADIINETGLGAERRTYRPGDRYAPQFRVDREGFRGARLGSPRVATIPYSRWYRAGQAVRGVPGHRQAGA